MLIMAVVQFFLVPWIQVYEESWEHCRWKRDNAWQWFNNLVTAFRLSLKMDEDFDHEGAATAIALALIKLKEEMRNERRAAFRVKILRKIGGFDA